MMKMSMYISFILLLAIHQSFPQGCQRGRDGRDGRDGFPGTPGPRSGGVVYTRWGSSSCPNRPITEMVYSGRIGGSYYGDQGGASNLLCMPPDPQYYLSSRSGVQGHSYMYGAEYAQPLRTSSAEKNVPCAVCSVATREQVLMIPAKITCPSSWTREYYGYLMTEKSDTYRSTFVCVDSVQEGIPGTDGNAPATDLWHVEAKPSGMACPPYYPDKELTCVVCTK